MKAKKVLVTGAGGFIGSKLALQLAESGISVIGLYHSKVNPDLKHDNIEFVRGNILDKINLENIIERCTHIYHVAALANNWAKDPKQFYDVNVTGTENIIEAGKKSGVEKIVVTSSAGAIGPALNGVPANEIQTNSRIQFGHYERSKIESEKKIIASVQTGMNIVIVNPTRVFGPGELSKSNAATKIIHRYIQKKWKFKIGNGSHIANYAFVDDVVNGHILAMEKGRAGERYILGGHNLSFNDFIKIITEVSGIKNTLVPVPLALIGMYAITENIFFPLLEMEPQITYSWVKKYKANWTTSTQKSEKELGYKITPIKVAVSKTINWLKQNEE